MRKEYEMSTVDKSQVTAKQLANSYYGRRPLSALNLIDDFLSGINRLQEVADRT